MTTQAPSPHSSVIWTRAQAGPPGKGYALLTVGVMAFGGFGTFAAWMANDPSSMRFMLGGTAFLVACLFVAPKLLRRARNHDAELTWDGERLRCGRQGPFDVAGMHGWTVSNATDVIYTGSGPQTRTPVMRLTLVRTDGSTSVFGWSYPHDDDVDRLREAMTRLFGPELTL